MRPGHRERHRSRGVRATDGPGADTAAISRRPAAGHAGQGGFPAGTVRKQFRIGEFGRVRELQNFDGLGRSRLRPDLRWQVQVHLRNAGAGQQLFRLDGGHDGGTRAGPEQLMDVLTKVRDAAS